MKDILLEAAFKVAVFQLNKAIDLLMAKMDLTNSDLTQIAVQAHADGKLTDEQLTSVELFIHNRSRRA